ncbi:hypothetical protein KTH73_04770 [Acinetobacter courvalinii]|uniref:hypothetical protein n=1 Tax=Acinetobacter courvalinii TaxID=280147 RepID=UPI0019014904|nr:hypothetical protein [Acinetobacter courvalinii]MBJ8418529.1 hypothetical protein [Acinetobacter courvalinii]MCU4390034.1 hypothetical protein [Acinetobacter courvalinii]MCU4575984.1 hypothetical protein [Acinetobacter courvalinii]MCU4639272.1 hypothetical protein [Acinetobacter courvalinii]
MWVIKAANGCAWLSIIVIAAAVIFSIYALSIPCTNDRICEMPPIHLFFFLMLIVSIVCNVIGMILSAIAMGDEPPIKESAKAALFFNGKIIAFNLVGTMFLFVILIV